MTQLHRRFTDDQVKALLSGYCQGLLRRAEIQEMLAIGKTRFFALLKEYREDPEAFSVAYERDTPGRLPAAVEVEIERQLLREKAIVEDKRLPISGYNDSALRDRLRKKGIQVFVTTIIDRAKGLDCYKPRKKRKTHDREVLTASIGALIQHDSSLHLWSPFASEKWVLITSIDDFSCMLLHADFVAKDTTWAHIQAVQALMQSYGVRLRYYVDSLRVFRFVQGRDSVWRKHVLQTDDVDTQWGKMMRVLGVDVTYALSPQAKGKVERPYQWLQDRIVRTCALEKISALEDVRAVLKEEVGRYNHHQVHSTTKEIPSIGASHLGRYYVTALKRRVVFGKLLNIQILGKEELAVSETTRGMKYITESVLYLALELGDAKWKLGFSIGLGQKPRRRTIEGRDLTALQGEIAAAKLRFRLPETASVRRRNTPVPRLQRVG